MTLTAPDLGHGTGEMYIGGPAMGSCSYWVRADGRRVALSPRQLQALSLSLQHGADEAAFRMGITTKTIRNLLTRLYRKLGVFGRFEAAVTLGWVHIPPELLDAPLEARELVESPPIGGRALAGPNGGRSLGRGRPPLTPPWRLLRAPLARDAWRGPRHADPETLLMTLAQPRHEGGRMAVATKPAGRETPASSRDEYVDLSRPSPMSTPWWSSPTARTAAPAMRSCGPTSCAWPGRGTCSSCPVSSASKSCRSARSGTSPAW